MKAVIAPAGVMILSGLDLERAIRDASPPPVVVALLTRKYTEFRLGAACQDLWWASKPWMAATLLPRQIVVPLWESDDAIYGFVDLVGGRRFFRYLVEDDYLERIGESWDELLRYWFSTEFLEDEDLRRVAGLLSVSELGERAIQDSDNGAWDDLPAFSGADDLL